MYSDNQDVEYFVEKSGGYKKFADNESIYILHPNGESQLYRSKEVFLRDLLKVKLEFIQVQ